MKTGTILGLILAALFIFWSGLFAVLPFYYPIGFALLFLTVFVVLIRGELGVDIDRPSGKDMADAPNPWEHLPAKCLEAPDKYDDVRKAA